MSSQRIHALPLHLANQIAAGEVVERPASVLKELVENSIDAGATQIDIQIEGAGSQLIRVTDNGNGIHAEDLALALSRHATSKLHSSDQLSHIDSLGFRGEALPSIASVSRLTLTSRQQDQDCGWFITGGELSPTPAAHPVGTSVSVAELFFNLPARRRFLRSDKTELHHLSTTLNRLALSRFDIGFSCQFADQSSLKLPALNDPASYAQRIGKICGSAFVREAYYLQQEFENISLHGWVGKSTAHRGQTDVQYFFINGRVIKDRIINHAIRQAYGESLPAGRQAAYVLYLTLPLDRVDVNVHPTKHEVRFRDARLVHGLITRAVEEALQQNSPETENRSSQLPLHKAISEHPSEINEVQQPYNANTLKTPLQKHSVLSAPVSAASHGRSLSSGMVLIHQRYALVTHPAPALVDLQQADLTLRQQQFSDAVASKSLNSRPILVPLAVPLDSAARHLIVAQQDLLEQFALELQLTNDGVMVKRIPYLLSQVDLHQLVISVVQALQIKTDTARVLADTLTQLMPPATIINAEQAQFILQQLPVNKTVDTAWYRKLDQATLTGLFSV
ncbi:DNA mismatch repair endonuclease MutL [Methylophaga sp. OBS4]|uniref:DNA mismatch repair endonuclease MutL n=1 Tax=Methylophaga sp. OBS4 TaxID=2991935 RepID=UPI002250C920|nr:DNA mismatch repair endonuclease MutL [Methylophaga sp. OBS4]MCX4187343.1 DNA mismatch repair endonuclease MutL [Methylophaga sp. OBS4]